jgi:predicted acetyltransferase
MRPGDTEADLDLLKASFMLPPHRLRSYAATLPEDGWVVELDGNIVAGLRAERLAQVLGGRSVTAAAVFGVKVGPECRGRGIGRALMRRMLVDLRSEGIGLATLYPTDARAYRGAGFEVAGAHNRYGIRSDRLESRATLGVERLSNPSVEVLDATYAQFASEETGLLIRSSRWWEARTLMPTESEPPQCFVIPGEHGLRGYLLLDRHDEGKLPYFTTHLRDLVWQDAEALLTLLAVAAGNVAVSPSVTWPGSDNDPVFAELDFSAATVTDRRLWMTRVLDPRLVLSARGFPATLGGRLTLQIEDSQLPENEEPFDLAIEGGRGVTGPATRDPIRMSIPTLAAIITGWLDPRAAARLGRIAGAGETDLELLAQALSGRPWLMEIF